MLLKFSGFTLFALGAVSALPALNEPKNILIDTDFLSFTDDVGAIALANAFKKQKKASILGIVSTVNSRYSIPAIDAINTYYGNPDIPFAQNRTVTNETAEANSTTPVFVTTLANYSRFPEDIHDGSNDTIHPPLEFYRDVLSKAKDKSVTILAIGFMNNLHALYHDQVGSKLVKEKVAELVVMGGDFGPNTHEPGLPNRAGYNLVTNLTAAKVLQEWPSPVTFLGSNIGRSVLTGAVLHNTSETNPVRAAYDIYHGGTARNNGSWDLLATYYAVLGIGEGSFQYGNKNDSGRIEIYPNATAAWNYSVSVPDSQRQHFLDFKDSNVTIAKKVDQLLTLTPNQNV